MQVAHGTLFLFRKHESDGYVKSEGTAVIHHLRPVPDECIADCRQPKQNENDYAECTGIGKPAYYFSFHMDIEFGRH